MLSPLQIEYSRIRGQQIMDVAKAACCLSRKRSFTGAEPSSFIQVLCVTWPTKPKVLSGPMPNKSAKPCSRRKTAVEVNHDENSGSLYVARLQMSFRFFLIFYIIHIFCKEHIFIISNMIKVIKNQIEYPTNSFQFLISKCFILHPTGKLVNQSNFLCWLWRTS